MQNHCFFAILMGKATLLLLPETHHSLHQKDYENIKRPTVKPIYRPSLNDSTLL
jgi:hypothetical protein